MKLIGTEIQGCYEIVIDALADERGFFARTFDQAFFETAGLEHHFPEHSVAMNEVAGTVRGLHFQKGLSETKIVRCERGSAFDVVVDLRTESSTFRKFGTFTLTDEKVNAVYIPSGCAHGYQTLVDGTVLSYQISRSFVPADALGVNALDSELHIPWPFPIARMSERDRSLPALSEYLRGVE